MGGNNKQNGRGNHKTIIHIWSGSHIYDIVKNGCGIYECPGRVKTQPERTIIIISVMGNGVIPETMMYVLTAVSSV